MTGPMISETELEVTVIRAPYQGMHHSGPNDVGVRVTHLPSGNSVFVCTENSQLKNRAKAVNALHYLLYPEAWVNHAA